jgi:predicted DNA-binding protein
MTALTIQLLEEEYQRLEKAAEQAGKSVHGIIHEWIAQLPEVEEPFDVTKDPIYQIEGWDSDAPTDLSVNLDKYLYYHSSTHTVPTRRRGGVAR